MKSVTLQIKPGTRFHLGIRDVDDTSSWIHSDTLFSALVTMIEWVYGDGSWLIEKTKDGKFKLSSAFPCLTEKATGKTLPFFPKPPIEFPDHLDIKNRKTLKGIKWVSKGVYEAISDSTTFSDGKITGSFSFSGNKDLTIPAKGMVALKTETSFSRPEFSFTSEMVMPKVTVHTAEKEGAFYQESSIQFNDYTPLFSWGFHFLIDHQLDDLELLRILTAFRMLGDEGIGGNKTTGCGAFESILVFDLNNRVTTGSPLEFALSLVNPADHVDFNKMLRYEITKRGGGSLGNWGKSNYHRKQARFIREGALSLPGVKGRIVDLSPESTEQIPPVYRNGIAFTLPFGVRK